MAKSAGFVKITLNRFSRVADLLNFDYKKTAWDEHGSYSLNFKKAALITLIAFNLLVLFSPRIDFDFSQIETKTTVSIDVENIPVTIQTKRNPPPPRPTLPVPTDDETVPEDETIAETDLTYTNIFDNATDRTSGPPMASITPPRPIAWVFPEFPDSEKKKGIQGIVKLSIHIDAKGKVLEVVVLENTTGSVKCAEAAIAAAYGSRFSPAREGSKAVSYWITQPYRFDSRK